MSHSQLVLESKALVRYNAEALLEETLRADESIMKLQKELGLKASRTCPAHRPVPIRTQSKPTGAPGPLSVATAAGSCALASRCAP